MLKVGFVGLGIMGKPMVMNMLKAGIDVTVSDLKQELVDEVVAAGGKSAASVKELAKGKDAVFTILPTAAIVQDVLTKEDGILAGVDAGTAPFLPSNRNSAVTWQLPRTAPSSMLP